MHTNPSFQRIVGFTILFFSGVCSSDAQVKSDFTSNDDGWTVFNAGSGATSSPVYSGTGGNSGGNISFTNATTAVNLYWTAPSKFRGNLGASYNQSLTFDLLVNAAGADNSIGDVILTNSATGTSVAYQLPAKPTAGSWTSYSVPLNEGQWHYSCPTCLAPNQIVFKQVLSNVTNLQIRLKYATTIFAPYISQLDNVVLNTVSFTAPPVVASISPTSGLAGTTVTITGANFNSTASQNAVYFKGTRATVTSATSAQLKVTVPTSASFGQVTVENLGTGLQGLSLQSFNPLFDNNKDYGSRIIPSSMKMGYSTVLPTNNAASNGFGNMDKGDLDGDGWIDYVATETSSGKIYAFRNLGTGGNVGVSSFASAIPLPSLASIPGGGGSLSEVIVVDVDSDGKLDVAASTSGNYGTGTGFLAVYRNTSTSGNISFASPLFFAYNYYSALTMATGDLDGDGRTDFAFTTGTSPGNLFISQNFSTPGNIDFAFGGSVSAATTSGYSDVVIGDLTGDGKPEIVCPGYNAAVLSVYQNNSAPGSISMASPFTVPASVSYTVQLAMADFDGDNKQDMAWSVYGAQYVYFTKNLYAGGTFDATSFGTTFQVANKLSNPLGIAVGDINADGQADVIMSGYSDLAVLQNVSTAGNLNSSSFSPTVVFQGSATAGGNIFALSPVIADVDGDNKPEAAVISSAGGLPAGQAGVYIFHNESFQPPQITNVNPSSASSGSTVTVTGNYLYTKSTTPQATGIGIVTPASNPSNTSFQINAPVGSSDNRISATLHGLQAFSPTQFYTQLNGGAGGAINSSTFAGSVDYNLSSFAANAGLAVADYDQDGKPDIIIDDNGTAKIYANTISAAGAAIVAGSFTKSATTLGSATHLRASDIDGDGITDIVTGGNLFAGQGITPNPIAFGPLAYSSINNANQLLVNHDFNLDGKPDVAVATTSSQIQVFENSSNAGAPFVYNGALATLSNTPLTYANPGPIVGLTAADFDGDGFEDIAYGVTGATSTLSILLNSGQRQTMTSAQFNGPTTFAALTTPQYITTADFDGDGKPDIALGYYSTGTFISVFHNTSTIGNLSFTKQDFSSPAYCNGLEVADIDGDGKPEIVSINNPSGSNGSFSVYRNASSSGTISFSSAVTFSLGTTVPKILALADVNLDNKTDIVISRTGSASATLSIFQNFISFPTISITTQPGSVYSVCDGATPTLSASGTGTTNIAYQWQIFNSGAGAFVNLSNSGGYSNVSTAALTINSTGNFGAGTYRCKISGDFAAPVYTNTVSFSVNPIPPTPTAPDANHCGPGNVILTATGGSSGQYLWYDQNGLIAGQNNSTYSTPSLSATTQYQVAITDGVCVSPKTNANAIIVTSGCATISVTTQPTDFTTCSGSTATFTTAATGTTNITYQWQFSPTGAVGSFNDIVNGGGYSNVATATLSVNTTANFGAGRYRCKINGDFASTVFTSDEGLFISVVPAAPTVQGASSCSAAALTLTASGGSNGQYRWYTVSSGGSPISGEVNNTYVTPTISSTTIYYVSVVNGSCEGPRAAVTATIGAGCSTPTITPESLATQVGGQITIDLKPLIATPNSTLDLTSLQIVIPPSSGATANINTNGILTITYSGIAFSGTENITIKACDMNDNCTQQQFGIAVAGDVTVFNGISPDGANPKFIIQNIELLPQTKNNTVHIFDRWENLVWHAVNYDNNLVVFTGHSDSGAPLPSGVYFYKIEFANGHSAMTGFISLRR
ncbi:MAG TPA: FG-GAP-like repeat-containing protein [Cyclobacteriaceae bacterium]|nr:FG-GAP-like repeat-containing protein [Cyclobacteriaceae bacterium]